VTAYVPSLNEVDVNGQRIELQNMPERPFDSLTVSGDQVTVEYTKGGTVAIDGSTIDIKLTP